MFLVTLDNSHNKIIMLLQWLTILLLQPLHQICRPIAWFSNTAANYHITLDLQSLSTINEYPGSDELHVGNGKGLQISHTVISTLHSSLLNPGSIKYLSHEMTRYSGCS